MADLKATHVTKMVMQVDLQCSKCYRKIKKVLCRYPQIRDQVYDEKQNTVTITVVCCSPENIKEKIARKAGDTVESIQIIPVIIKPTPPRQDIKPTPSRPAPPLALVQGFPYPVCVCCCCHGGRPCYHGRGPMCYDRGCCMCRCYEYFSEENASGCSIM